MGIQGTLRDITVADLIQQFCQDRKLARLQIKDTDDEIYLYFKDGNLPHAQSNHQKGEEAVYQALTLQEGVFILDPGIEPPEISIQRSWSGLLLEGARRLDEDAIIEENQTGNTPYPSTPVEEKTMAQKIDDLLKELSGEVNGYMASAVVGMDGISIASHTVSRIDKESVSAQLTLLMKLIDTSIKNFGPLLLEDSLTTTDDHYFMMRYLPGKEYFLSVIVDRKTSSLGNLRLLTKLFSEKIGHAIPHS